MEQYGLRKPDHRLGGAHPTISADLLSRVSHGEVQPKPNNERLEGDRVRFADGSVEKADVVVYCTGYKVTFPFFDEDFISAPDNEMALFKRTFHPETQTSSSYDDFMLELEREMKRGRARAAKRGRPLEVEPRAAGADRRGGVTATSARP